MKNIKVNDTRNFALIGHARDGKTSLGEAILFASGATKALGSVSEGSSSLNYLPEEKAHESSITSAVYSFDTGGKHSRKQRDREQRQGHECHSYGRRDGSHSFNHHR